MYESTSIESRKLPLRKEVGQKFPSGMSLSVFLPTLKKIGFECLFAMIWNRVYLSWVYRMLARICLVIQGLVDNLNSRLENRVSTWYMIIYKLRYLIVENIKFSVDIHIITWDVEMLVQSRSEKSLINFSSSHLDKSFFQLDNYTFNGSIDVSSHTGLHDHNLLLTFGVCQK